MRLFLTALVALLLAIAVGIAGYALWLGVARPRGPERFADPAAVRATSTAADSNGESPGDPIPDPVRPSLPAPRPARAVEASLTAPAVRAALPTHPLEVVVDNLTELRDGATLVLVDGQRGVPLAHQKPSGPDWTARWDRIPAGEHEIYLTVTPDQPWRSFIAKGTVTVPASEPVHLDAFNQTVTVVLELPEGFTPGDGPSARAGLDLAALHRDGESRWRPPFFEIGVSKARAATAPPTVVLTYHNLGPGNYTLEWPKDLRAVAVDPLDFTVPGTGEYRLEVRRP